MFLLHKPTIKNDSETSSGRDLIQSESETDHLAGKVITRIKMNPTENPLVDNEEVKQKRIPFNSSIPYSHSLGYSS